MASFRFSRPKFVYGIERGVVARRLAMVYVLVADKSSIEDGLVSKGEVTAGGEALREYLQLRGLTASEFSREVPCSVSLPGQWIRGVATPSYRMAVRVEQITDGIVSRTLWFPPGPQQAIDQDLEELP